MKSKESSERFGFYALFDMLLHLLLNHFHFFYHSPVAVSFLWRPCSAAESLPRLT